MSEKLQPQMARRASPNKSKTPAQRKRDQRRREAALAAAHMMRLRVAFQKASLITYVPQGSCRLPQKTIHRARH